MSITYSECVSVDLDMQHAMRMRHIIFSSVACPVLTYFSALCLKRRDFQKKSFWILNACFICVQHFFEILYFDKNPASNDHTAGIFCISLRM
jgi:hypothetical protein